MATYTKNYNLAKPGSDDPIDISVLNANFDIIDEKTKEVKDAIPPVATQEKAGIVKPDGTTITVDPDGTIRGAQTYVLPQATENTLGGIKVGKNLTMGEDGKLNAHTDIETDAEIDRLKQDLATANTALSEQQKINSDQSLEIKKLQASLEGNLYLFQVDDTEAYEKPVPKDARTWAALDKIGGKTLVWNQLVENGDFQSLSGWKYMDYTSQLSVNNNILKIAPQGMLGDTYHSVTIPSEHKYIVAVTARVDVSTDNKSQIGMRFNFSGSYGYFPCETNFKTFYWAGVTSSNVEKIQFLVNAVAAGSFAELKNAMVFDLTAMFGAGNEPSTPEEFRTLFPADYYPYSEPTLMNFSNSAVVSRGENLIDFEECLKTWKIPYEKNGNSYTFAGLGSSYFQPIRFSDEPIDVVLGAVTTDDDCRIGVCYVDKDGKKSNLGYIDRTTLAGRNAFSGVNALYMDGRPEGARTITNPFVYKNTNSTVFKPYKETIYDTSAIVQKYFPDGMKSAGTVHDEIDWERMVAIQRVGSVVYDGVNSKITKTNDIYGNTSYKYNYAYNYPSEVGMLPIKQKAKITSTIGYEGNAISKGHENGGIITNDIIYVFIPNVAVEGNTKKEYLEAFNKALQANPVSINYELAEPIETPITEEFDASIEVESGGTLTFENDQGTDFHVPVPNQETFMIKLPGGAT